MQGDSSAMLGSEGTLRSIARIAFIFVVLGICMCNTVHAQFIDRSSGTKKTTFAFCSKILTETEMKDARSAINYWIKKMAKNVGSEVEGYVYEDLDSLRNDFKKGILDWVSLTPDDYMNIRNDIEAELGLSPLLGGTHLIRYQLIVQANAPISNVEDLRGKTIAVTARNENVRQFLNLSLWEKKLQGIDTFFRAVVEKRTYPQAILAVFFGQVDACVATSYASDTIAELNPQIRQRLKVIAESPPLLHSVTIYRKTLEKESRDKIEEQLNNLNASPDGKQVLLLFGIDGMIPITESDLDSFREFYQKYVRLKAEYEDSGFVNKINR